MITATKNYTPTEARSIAEIMLRQIGRNALYCIGTRRRTHGEVEGNIRLTIKTSNCGSRNRYVEVTLEQDDTYTVKGVNIQLSKRGISRKVKYTASDVYCDQLSDIVIEAADAKN